MRNWATGVLMVVPLSAAALAGSTKPFDIHTQPAGARITLTTGQTCVSPCRLELARHVPFAILAERDGYHPVVMKVFPNRATGDAATAAPSGIGLGTEPHSARLSLVAVPAGKQPDPRPDLKSVQAAVVAEHRSRQFEDEDLSARDEQMGL